MTARTAKHRTVIDHVLSRLRAVGISEVFGVPGDYAFPVQDAIVNFPGIEWVGCCNELSAAYAADGYARIRGLGAVSTTYGVGELSAINAIAGAWPGRAQGHETLRLSQHLARSGRKCVPIVRPRTSLLCATVSNGQATDRSEG
jgi:hypothetical protein